MTLKEINKLRKGSRYTVSTRMGDYPELDIPVPYQRGEAEKVNKLG